MSEPPEFWMFVVSNSVILLFGSVLTVLSYSAYRRTHGNRSFRNATIGFCLITLGGLVEPIYQLFVRGSYELFGRELLGLQTIENVLIAMGLGVLFYSIYRYKGSGDYRGPASGIDLHSR